MQQHAAPDIGFDLWDEDGLVFDDEPELFVHLDAQPLVFTVRGIRYFGPRFKHLGVDIAAMQSKVDFMIAFNAWMAARKNPDPGKSRARSHCHVGRQRSPAAQGHHRW
jgi:hypothetical protein